MQEAEEQDTCRICSGPGEPDQPLFHPCKCSGTIRYIHQDCLTTWLSHSKKKSCDVCKHPYSFTKVYAADMPSRLPFFLLLRKIVEQVFFAILFVFRVLVVGLIWLAMLPLVTVYSWRTYFAVGEALAWWVTDRPRPPETEAASVGYSAFGTNSTLFDRSALAAHFTRHPAWLEFWSDIFTGQIIASIIILSFIALFLLREWISQNARPGVFDEEDEEILRAAPPPPVPPAQFGGLLPPPPPIPPPRPPVAEAFLQPQVRPPPPDTPPPAIQPDDETLRPMRHTPQSSTAAEVPLLVHTSLGAASSSVDRGMLPTSVSEEVGHTSNHAIVHRNPWVIREDGEEELPSEFKPIPRTSSEPGLTRLGAAGSSASGSGQLSRPVLPPPWSQPTSPYEPGHPRRPPLPGVTLPSPGGKARSPMGSPNLATYKAPEEIQSGSSPLADYFGLEAEPVAGPSTQAEFHQYFRVPSGDNVAHASVSAVSLPPTAPEPAPEYEEIVAAEQAINPRHAEQEEEEEDIEPPEHDFPEFDGFPADEDADDDSEGDMDEPAAFDEEEEGDLDLDGEEDLENEEEEEEGDDDDDEEDVADADVVLVDPAVEQAGEPLGDVDPLPALPPALPPALDGPAPQDVNEELEVNPEDDIEGILEAIGLRGPYYTIIQNAALMIFILDTALGFTIWLPFTLGKTSALLSLYPTRFLEILHLPIRLIRLITDPIVDFAVALVFLPFISRFSVTRSNVTDVPVEGASGGSVSSWFIQTSQGTKDILSGLFGVSSVNATLDSAPRKLNLEDYIPDILLSTEPQFAAFGREVRINYTSAREQWYRIAVGQSNTDRMVALFLGYLILALSLAIYLNVLTMGNMRSAGRAVRSTVRQQLLVLKVASFILIELFLFPLGCGVVLDVCTLWLFSQSTVESRISFFFQAPLTSVFYHWAAGTMFMYCFAILLSGCRAVIRPGSMWFIKDPQDHNSHPIRDILERPTLQQLRKIGVSGIMYSVVVVCVACSLAGLMVLGSRSSIMPFRWKIKEPLSTVPIDLLFLNFTLPYGMYYFRPKGPLKRATRVVWMFLADELRLSSYFFGGDITQDEPRPWTWNPFRVLMSESTRKDQGSYRRVPATDKIALGRDMRATAAVTKDGVPVDDEAKELIRLQDSEALKAKRDPKVDYMIVYIPPMFRWRVILLITMLWLLAAVGGGIFVAAPILVGRGVFRLFITREVHDGYSFILGFYLLWACFQVSIAVDRLDKRRQRARDTDGPRGNLLLLTLKRGSIWLAKISYLVLMLGLVIPPLLSIALELYVIWPLRFLVQPDFMPRIRLVESWALGLMYGKIALQLSNTRVVPGQPRDKIVEGVHQLKIHGWTNPNIWRATRDLIAPLVGGTLAMIFAPLGAFRVLSHFVPVMQGLDNRFIFQHVYPGIFVIVGIMESVSGLSKRLTSWSQTIRDKEFLVELRLRNHEPELKSSSGAISEPELRPPVPEVQVHE